MIGSSRRLRVFAYAGPVDMRCGFDGLYGLVANDMKQDVLGGELFLFVSRTRKRAKVLFWDGTGLVVYAKRLEKGRFTAPWERVTRSEPLEMTVAELALFLEGSAWAGRVPLSPAPFVFGPLASFELPHERR
jgi:transposase